MENNLPLEEQSISNLFLEASNAKTYTVPIYQRNYAWGEDEIGQLIADVCDSCEKGDHERTYYIGTLVTYGRGDGVYEVIDGQQRLTTIYIILKALGAVLKEAEMGLSYPEIYSKLTYTARHASASTIDRLGEYPSLGGDVDGGIRNGYAIAKKAIDEIATRIGLETFKKYFCECVHIIHYRVPKDVDLNHYFEVMNSRGEQLEKHEIVKSLLYQCLGVNDRAAFSRAWEACSEMGTYIQDAFPEISACGKNEKGAEKKKLFNDIEELEKFTFEDIPHTEKSGGRKSIKALMRAEIENVSTSQDTSKSDKFQPIIDFPNFLLVVLKITLIRGKKSVDKVALDDKELLKVFENVLNQYEKHNFAKQFVVNLLKAKYLLDNYVVHHTIEAKEQPNSNPWLLNKIPYGDRGWNEYVSIDKGESHRAEENRVHDELVHLLSMFEVTYTAKQRKNYLVYCLLYLFDNREPRGYLRFLQRLADKYFYDVYMVKGQPSPDAFDKSLIPNGKLCVQVINTETKFANIYEPGNAGVPLFVFNYTDYVLWKKYAYEIRGKKLKKSSAQRERFFSELGCSDFGFDGSDDTDGLEVFNRFYFTRTRRSLEHFFPQANVVEGQSPSRDEINCFGNFAMIGASANSSGSNWSPKTKLDHYIGNDKKIDPVSVASLKFRIMMQICRDNYDKHQRAMGQEWTWEDIKTHQDKMLDLIMGKPGGICDECGVCDVR